MLEIGIIAVIVKGRVLLEIQSMHKLVQYFQTLHGNEDIYELKDVHIATFEAHLFSSNVEHCTISNVDSCLLYTSPSPRDRQKSRMPSSA